MPDRLACRDRRSRRRTACAREAHCVGYIAFRMSRHVTSTTLLWIGSRLAAFSECATSDTACAPRMRSTCPHQGDSTRIGSTVTADDGRALTMRVTVSRYSPATGGVKSKSRVTPAAVTTPVACGIP